ncbi:MAG: hypothetical protein CMM87_03985 [Rickettsiales bacterium]|nr:hypothetical protein [Rickettsiales bacterium]|tara:strand:+ start:55202 stop:55777 length:576 start_codon:yes stop_codon:yes gene_type:complete
MKNLSKLPGLFLVLICFVQLNALPNNFPSDEEMQGQLIQMKQVYEKHMKPFTMAYHDHIKNRQTNYKHSDLKTMFDSLPRCSLTHQGHGHLNYRHDDFPLHFGLGRVNGNIDTGAFKGLYDQLQPFMNFLCNDIFYLPTTPRTERKNNKNAQIIYPFTDRPIREQLEIYKQYVDNPDLFNERMNHYRGLLA